MRHQTSHLIAVLTLLFFTLNGVAIQSLAADPPEWEHIQKAKDYREQGQFKAAVIELKNAALKNPDNPEARRLLGEVYLELGQGADAEKELRRAREAGLAPAAMLVQLGEALLLQGEFSELLQDLQPADLQPADAARVHALRGEAHLGLQETEAAAGEFTAALAIDPGLTRARVGQARLTLAEDKPDEARTQLETALATDADDASAWSLLGALEQGQGRKREAEAAYTEALDRNPLLTGARLQRAQMRTELGDFAGAGDDIAAVRKQAPKHPGVFYAEGLLHFRQAQLEPATAALDQFLNAYPDDLSTMFYLGLAHYELGNLQQAEEYLSRVVARLPQAADAARYLGLTRLRLDDFSGAETVLRPLVERQPDDVAALRALARALQGQGRQEQANEYLRQTVALQPESAQDRLELAVSQLRLGQGDAAITELQQAIALDPEFTQGDMLLIRVYLQAGDFDQAIEAAERLRVKQPDSPDPVTLLAIAYAGKGETGKARAAFEEALHKEPGNPSAAINLASMALNEDDLDTARGYYQQVLAQHPDHAETLLRMAQLESREGNQETARARLQEAVKKNPEALQPRVALGRFQLQAGEPLQAVTTVRGAPQRYAGHPDLLAVLGEAQLANGETASAVATLKKLVAAQPSSARAHYLLGSAYAASKDIAAAKQELLEGMQTEPDDVLASWLMTRLSSLQPGMEAKNAWVEEELKALYPEHPQVLDLEAQLALKQGAAERAVAIYKGLHERFPEESVWTMNFANAQWEAGDRDGHIATLSAWLEQHPEDVRAQFRLAFSYLALERLDAAQSAFAKVVELQPDNTVALNNLALLLLDKDPKEAHSYAERAYQLNPDPRVMDTLGVTLLHQGETQRAMKVLKEASVKRPDLATIKYHYAMALAQSGRQDEARKVLKRLADADFPEKAEAHALLAELGD